MLIRVLFILALLLPILLPLTACKDNVASNEVSLEESLEDTFDRLVIQNADGKSYAFDIEMVTTPQEMAKGLMHRTEMAENAGMLFYFGGKESEKRFWMKNTLIPLDMIFILSDGTIHHIHENAVPHDLTRISSQGPVAAVLEINGGLSAQWGIMKGDKINHPIFSTE